LNFNDAKMERSNTSCEARRPPLTLTCASRSLLAPQGALVLSTSVVHGCRKLLVCSASSDSLPIKSLNALRVACPVAHEIHSLVLLEELEPLIPTRELPPKEGRHEVSDNGQRLRELGGFAILAWNDVGAAIRQQPWIRGFITTTSFNDETKVFICASALSCINDLCWWIWSGIVRRLIQHRVSSPTLPVSLFLPRALVPSWTLSIACRAPGYHSAICQQHAHAQGRDRPHAPLLVELLVSALGGVDASSKRRARAGLLTISKRSVSPTSTLNPASTHTRRCSPSFERLLSVVLTR
jgi:hypothetical protein